MRNVWVIAILTVLTAIVFYKSFANFFVQDDFILLNYFSNLKNVFSWPTVTHFRPLHNLFFFVSGNLFGHNLLLYHLLSYSIHIFTAFFVYKVIVEIAYDKRAALIGSIVYATSVSHFVSMFWISGAATTLGFALFIASFFLFIKGRPYSSTVFFLLSLFASEAMATGIGVHLAYWYFLTKRKNIKYVGFLSFVIATFVLLRLLFFTNTEGTDYGFKVGIETLETLRYYVLRITGFGEGSTNYPTIAVLLAAYALLFYFFFKRVLFAKVQIAFFVLSVMVTGLFPFVLIPQHLSGHYMNISIFGLAMLVSVVAAQMSRLLRLALIFVFVGCALIFVESQTENHWVVRRANLAREFLQQTEQRNLPDGSDVLISNMEEYYALGTGEAINFWFGDRFTVRFELK